jgi:hypothetical protein
MGFLNGRNLRMAKELLEKNRHKVGDAVGKATEKVDQVSGGKTSSISKKAEDAARKYSAGSSATHHGAHPDAVPDNYSGGSVSKEDAELRRAQAQAKAATALAGLANAANGFLAKAQARVDEAEGKMPPPDATTSTDNPPPPDATTSTGKMPPPDATTSTDNPPPLDSPPALSDS